MHAYISRSFDTYTKLRIVICTNIYTWAARKRSMHLFVVKVLLNKSRMDEHFIKVFIKIFNEFDFKFESFDIFMPKIVRNLKFEGHR